MDGHSGEKSVKDFWEVGRVLMDVEDVVMNAVSMHNPCKYKLGGKRMEERERVQGK